MNNINKYEDIKGLRNIYLLLSELQKRFCNLVKSKWKTRNADGVKKNYKYSWGEVELDKKWENYNSLAEFLNPHNPEKKNISTYNGEWVYVSLDKFLKFRVANLKSIIESNLSDNTTAVVEVGCGWGRNLFALREAGYDGPLKGYELTSEGVRSARAICEYFQVENITIEQLDLINDNIVERDALIYSYHCFEQIKYHTKPALNNLLNSKAQKIIHFEPIRELYNYSSIRGLVNLAYNSLADYQQTLLTNLLELENNDLIKIKLIEPLGYYQLPIQETSLVIWEPLNE